jgi:hypothetical protein
MGDPIACRPWLPKVEHRAMVASITFDLLAALAHVISHSAALRQPPRYLIYELAL